MEVEDGGLAASFAVSRAHESPICDVFWVNSIDSESHSDSEPASRKGEKDRFLSGDATTGQTIEWAVERRGEGSKELEVKRVRTSASRVWGALRFASAGSIVSRTCATGALAVFTHSAARGIELKGEIQAGPGESCALCVRNDGRRIASLTFNGAVNIFDADELRLLNSFSLDGFDVSNPLLCVTYSQDGKSIAVGAKSGGVVVIEADSGDLIRSFSGHSLPVRSVCFSPLGDKLYAASDDATVSVHTLAQDEAAKSLCGHLSPVLCVSASTANEDLVCTASADKTIKFWINGRCEATFTHPGVVQTVAFSPSGALVASADTEGNIFVTPAPTAKS